MAALGQDMGVNHGCFHIGVAQELLDRPNIRAALQQVGCKTVSKRVGAHRLCNGGFFDCYLDCLGW